AGRAVGGMFLLDVHLSPDGPRQPEAEGADAEEETDQGQEVAEAEDLAVGDLHPHNARENQRPRADDCTNRGADYGAHEPGLQCSQDADSDPLGGGWLPSEPGFCFRSQAFRAARLLTTVVKRMFVWPK